MPRMMIRNVVLGQPGRIVVAGQVGRDGVVAALPQLPLDQMPVPPDVAAAVNQRKGGHSRSPSLSTAGK
jgi:hypothetical protein